MIRFCEWFLMMYLRVNKYDKWAFYITCDKAGIRKRDFEREAIVERALAKLDKNSEEWDK